MTSAGNYTIDFLCLNIDSAGHTTEDASSAISSDVLALLEILQTFVGPKVKLSVITGDAGGGASVQQLHPALKKKGIMDDKSKRLSCELHNLNKALEVACIDTWGRQGIGHLTPFQMIWLFVRVLKHIRKELGDRSLLDEAWGMTIQSLRVKHSWQETACDKCELAFTEFMSRLEELEGGDNKAIDTAVKITSKAPANLQDPVMTRWGTILAAVEFFANNWVVIYFFAMTLANSERSNSHLNIMCCALLSLMHNTLAPQTINEADNEANLPTDDGKKIDDYIASFGSKKSAVTGVEGKDRSATPIFLAVIHFLDGFNKAFFSGEYSLEQYCHVYPNSFILTWLVVVFHADMFNFMKMNDPFLGEGTFGQLARFGPERCYTMHKLLKELEGGVMKEQMEFQRFRAAYESVAGDTEKQYLDKAVEVFFQRFRTIFEKHMVAKWTSTEIVQYLLGGDPHHAKEFARWLVHHQSNKETSSDESSTGSEPAEFSFEKKLVTLGKHHRRYRNNTVLDIEMNLQESMEFITMNADPLVILRDPFIERNWGNIESLATETTTVDIWDKYSTSFNKYTPFQLDIIFSICIHSPHQQRCENYVQLCGLLSSTRVGEVR